MNNRDAQLNQARTRRNQTKKIEEITAKKKMKNTYLNAVQARVALNTTWRVKHFRLKNNSNP